MKLQKKLKLLMVKKGVNNEDLAAIIGVNKATISIWRSGNNSPKHQLLEDNAKALVVWSNGKITLKDCGIQCK
jgi:transcriptional regulator with XRE-family HTH domain